MCRFWWKTDAKKNKGIHWASWDRMCKPKSNGSMGFRKLHDFNIALLAKQAWWILNNKESLATRVFKARYFPKCSFLEAGVGNNPSFIWRSIWAAQSLVKAGTRWRMGSGDKIRILEDAWLQDNANHYIVSRHPALQNQNVTCLMKTGTREWDGEVIQDLFEVRDQILIYGIPLSNGQEDDIRYWFRDRSGLFTVKSVYNLLQDLNGDWVENANSGFWRRLWNLKIPPKVKNFLWRAANGYLPTKAALRLKHVPI